MVCRGPGQHAADGGNPRLRADGGYVLVAVLWALVLFSAVVIALTLTVRSRVETTANFAAREEARLLADGVADLIAADWVKPEHRIANALELKADGRAVRCKSGEAILAIRMVSVNGLVDLNAAPLPLLERLFLGLKLPEERARTLASAIIDFRDGDDIRQTYGAEEKDYTSAGLPYGPKNNLFQTVDELDQVLGLSRDVFNAVKPYVTVHSGLPYVDEEVAPPELLAALRPDQINSQVRATEIFGHAAQSSRITRIFVTVETAGGGRFVRDATIEVEPHAPRGFLYRDWTTLREEGATSMQNAVALAECF